MHNLASWSFWLGRWFGVHLRVHVFFIFFALVSAMQDLGGDRAWYWLTTLAALLFSALLHEAAHVFVARRVGGICEQVVLWPGGGLAPPNVWDNPAGELLATLAGPVINLMVCLSLVPALVLLDLRLVQLNPLAPPWGEPYGIASVLATIFWVNWVLALVNLLPAFPFDAGRVVKAWLSSRSDQATAVVLVSRLGIVVWLGLFIAAWFVYEPAHKLPCISLVMLGVVVMLAGRHEVERLHEREVGDSLFGYDFSQGYTSLARSFEQPGEQPSFFRRWLERRRQLRQERQLALELEEERRVDEILSRLHALGMESLSDEDRAILFRVSQRYRSRDEG